MNKLVTNTLLISCLALPGAALAQARFSLGPQVGYTASTASYITDYYHTRYRSGYAAGVLANLHLGLVSLQPALQFSQKGYYLTNGDPAGTGGSNDDSYRLNYVSLPFQVVLTPRRDGQGVQLLAGYYLALLVGGHYQRNYTLNGVTTRTEGDITPDDTSQPYAGYSSQSVDDGVFAGLGYRFRQVQLQATYSWGWPSLSVDYTFRGQRLNNPNYVNRALQVSLAYLFPFR